MDDATDDALPVDDDVAVDDGPEKAARQPIRRCLATGARLPRERLIRFVLDPDGRVVPDFSGTLPGRGMWLSADARSIKTAQDRKLFARAARAKADAPSDLADRVEALLARRCIDTVSLARRAGEAVCGFEKTRAALKADGAAVLLQARDGAADGRAKLAALAGEETPVSAVLDAVELGQAFGRDAAVHAALAPGGLSRRYLVEAGRLVGFRGYAAGAAPAGKDD